MAEKKRMRMAELARVSGVSRETIHYYLREGLLPRPVKGGKTVAYYDDTHLERLRLIRRLREEKYLPLAVIRRILEAGPDGPSERDVETLTDVLSIDPTFGRLADLHTVDDEAVRVALELGLLGKGRSEASATDTTEQRVLASVAEALALEGDARQLTLDDMQICARELSLLVEREASLFFDLVIDRGDMADSVQALRAGRAAVARFITAYRDLMLRGVVDDLLTSIADEPAPTVQLTYLPLGDAELERLGEAEHRRELLAAAERGDAAAANDVAWHLFVLASDAELAELSPTIVALLRPRARFLVQVARAEVAAEPPLEQLGAELKKTGSFALGQVLYAQLRLAKLVREPHMSFLERAVPVLHELARTDADQDADPLASACAFHRRGLVRLSLPRVLGRHTKAATDLERALAVLMTAPGRIGAAARARLEGNVRLTLGFWYAQEGQREAALEHLERARAIDSTGPIGARARRELTRSARQGLRHSQ